MQVLSLIMSLFFGVAIGSGVTYFICQSVNIDYKERWETATKLLNMDPEKAKLLKADAVVAEAKLAAIHNSTATIQEKEKEKKRREFANINPATRRKMDKDRMAEGWDPIDPLTDLPPDIFRLMKKDRMKEGFDPE
jgi:hypothetical protein